eukprot:Clim_evm72s153 gene=Clim_evmTU72s153
MAPLEGEYQRPRRLSKLDEENSDEEIPSMPARRPSRALPPTAWVSMGGFNYSDGEVMIPVKIRLQPKSQPKLQRSRRSVDSFITQTFAKNFTVSTYEGTEGVTFQYQKDLPRLPVPSLDETLDRYLSTILPLVSKENYKLTKQIVQQSLQEGSPMYYLQDQLVKRANDPEHPSWLEEWWDDAYLCTRTPCPQINFQFLLRDGRSDYDQITRAAAIICAALKYKQLIDDAVLEPDRERETPLCMAQYPRQFSSTRIPLFERDQIICYQRKAFGRNENSKTCVYEIKTCNTVLILYKGHIFPIHAYDHKGHMRTASAFASDLADIKLIVESMDEAVPIGVFTGDERDIWARMRERLIDISNQNANNLEMIQRGIVVICLDDQPTATDAETVKQVMYGEPSNRWFDKNQIIVTENGGAGMNWEHSQGDGSTALRLADFIFAESERLLDQEDIIVSDTLSSRPVPLYWESAPDVDREIIRSHKRFEKMAGEVHIDSLIFNDFGINHIKTLKCSPDAFVQMAFQLTWYSLYGFCTPTYESCATKNYLHGRTETVRSTSVEALRFCEAMSREKVTPEECAKLLREACAAHVEYIKAAKRGHGCDRHLYGLHQLAKELLPPKQMPALFLDKNYAESQHWNMSTSNCGSHALTGFSFAPVAEDGYGLGYTIQRQVIAINISSFDNGLILDAVEFGDALAASLKKMSEVCERADGTFDPIHSPSVGSPCRSPTRSSSPRSSPRVNS